jgi:hypothetical protein
MYLVQSANLSQSRLKMGEPTKIEKRKAAFSAAELAKKRPGESVGDRAKETSTGPEKWLKKKST